MRILESISIALDLEIQFLFRHLVRCLRRGRDKVGCIILGRGEDDKKVQEWLAAAAVVPGFVGFAVGRTDFWQPLVDFRAKKMTRQAAVAEIAGRYREFVHIFESARAGIRSA